MSQYKLAISLLEAVDTSGMSRAFLYEAMRAGELAFLKIGRRRLILVDDLRAWLATKRNKAA